MDTLTDQTITTNIQNSDNKLPIKETIKEAWQHTHGFKATIWLSVLIIILATVAYYFLLSVITGNYNILSLIQQETDMAKSGNTSVSVIVLKICFELVKALLSYGIIYLALRRVANLVVKSRMMFRTF